MVEYSRMDNNNKRYTYHFIIALEIVVAVYIIIYTLIGQDIFSHGVYDSYTRQAEAWWQGSTSLPENVTWLELAQYNGKYFVSFPPFPTVVQFLLYPIFGINTPNNLVNTLFGLGAFVLSYKVLTRRGYGGLYASAAALLMTLGSNLLYLSTTGWVWFSAQAQGFFFSLLAVFLIYSKNKKAWYFSFLSLGIAVACRPFQLVYAPLLLYLLYGNIKENGGLIPTLARCIKYVLPMIFVGIGLAAYNYIRFGNILEFGHNYLPEFTDEKQFSLSYVPGNFLQILKLPSIRGGSVVFPQFDGTLFFLVNPVYILLAVNLFGKFGKKQALYLACFAAHLVLLLSHKTMGGWQFGSRYLVDMIPFMPVVFERGRHEREGFKEAALPIVLALIGIAVNIYGTVWYYTQIYY